MLGNLAYKACLLGIEPYRKIEERYDRTALRTRVPFIFDDMSPTHGRLPIAPQIVVPKDLSSEMSLEVA